MKKLYFSIFALLVQLSLNAQTPTLQWAKSMGESSGVDIFNKIIPLSTGDLYVVGRFEATVDFDPGTAVFNLTAGGSIDIVIAKYTSLGDFIWAKKIGGSISGSNNSHIIDPGDAVVDQSDNLYITGSYIGTIDMDPSSSQYLLLPPTGGAGLNRVFVGKYNTNGDLQWAFGYGASDVSNNPSYNKGLGVYIDKAGDLLLTGKFHRTCDFDPGSGTFELTSINTFEDIFFAKYTTAGDFLWAKKVDGGGIQDTPTGIISDSSNNIYICGYIAIEADFDPGAGVAMVLSNDGGGDIFLAKYDANGNYQWAFSAGSSVFYDVPGAIGLDKEGRIMLTGYFTGTVDFDPGSGTSNLTSSNSSATIPDLFIAKYTADGNLLWAKSLQGPGYKNSGNNILMDKFGRIFIAGSFTSTLDFDPGVSVTSIDAGPTATAAYIAQYDTDGNYLNAAAISGANSYFNPWGLFVDTLENIYFSGGFEQEADFDPGAAVLNLTATGTRQDIFMAKYSTGSALLSGTVWIDNNANGLLDNAEQGIAGITLQMIYDRNNNGNIEPGEGVISTVSLSDGSYNFSKMPAGNYIIHATLPGGYNSTTAITADADLTNGQLVTGRDFGVQLIIVPLTCNDFFSTVQNNKVVLKWAVVLQTNTKGFNVQRSRDGINFETIGWVNASSNSVALVNFEFTDTDIISPKIYYYRLQEISLNGMQQFVCRVVLVRFEGKDKWITIFPNPAREYVNLDMNKLPAGLLAIRLYDAKGILTIHKQMNISAGSTYERLSLTALPAGIYQLVISVNNSVMKNEKIIKY